MPYFQKLPEPIIPYGEQDIGGKLSDFDLSLHGENYHVKITGFAKRSENKQSCYLWVDGVPEEVIIEQELLDESDISPESANLQATGPGDISVAMPSTVIAINVDVNDEVKKGQSLLVVEAMKMETDIQAPMDGKIARILCKKGDKVVPKQVLMILDDH
jgi:pyruvate carboxylase subunit B